MPEILIQVKNKEPKIVGNIETAVSDNSDYTIRFMFDEQWEDSPKTVYFVRSNGYAFAPAKTVDDTVAIPIQNDVGILSRLYVGVQQGDVKTSQACEIVLRPSIAECIDDNAVQPEPDMWQDLLRRFMETEYMRDEAVEAKEAAEAARDDANESAKSAAESAESAEKSADRAEQVAVANGFAQFYMKDGRIYLLRTSNIKDKIDFRLENGRMVVKISG